MRCLYSVLYCVWCRPSKMVHFTRKPAVARSGALTSDVEQLQDECGIRLLHFISCGQTRAPHLTPLYLAWFVCRCRGSDLNSSTGAIFGASANKQRGVTTQRYERINSYRSANTKYRSGGRGGWECPLCDVGPELRKGGRWRRRVNMKGWTTKYLYL